jgi:hypothetical protein
MKTKTKLKIKTKLLLASLLLLLAGCGDSTDFQQVSGQQQPVSEGSRPELQGFWGGFFPQSNDMEGIELHFHRDRGFIVRDGERPLRQDMVTQRDANTVSVTLTSVNNPQDQSRFTGSFVNDTTISGTFANEFRGDSFPMTLTRHPKSDSLSLPQGGVAGQAVRSQGSGAQTLQITITDTNDKVYSMYFGLAYEYDESAAAGANVPGFEPLGTLGQEFACDVSYLAFYPQWSVFETLVSVGPSRGYLTSLEVLETEWAATGYQISGPLGEGGNSTVTDGAGNVQTVKSFTMQIVSTDTEYNLPDYQQPYEPGNTLSYSTKYGTYPNMPTSLFRFLRREYS